MNDDVDEGMEWWQSLGIVLVVVAAVAGLVIVAMIVLSVLAMGSFGSNK